MYGAEYIRDGSTSGLTQQVRTRNPRRFRRLHSRVASYIGKDEDAGGSREEGRRGGGVGGYENAHKGYFSLSFSQFLPQPIPTSAEVRARAWPSAYNVTSARAI